MGLVSALVGALGAGACAHGAAGAGHEKIELGGVVVRAKPDPLTHLSIYDAGQLFHLAGEAERNGKPERARLIYQKLLANFGSGLYANPAAFNLGLLDEHARQFAAAAAAYQRITTQPVPAADDGAARRTWLDARYRLAVCEGKLKRWWDAVAVFDDVLKLDWLGDDDRLEAMTGRGIAMQEGGQPDAAEIAFAGVLRFYRQANARGPVVDSSLAAEAAFRMGDIAAARFDKITLAFPIDVLRQRLEAKCEQLLSAQDRYLRALRYGDAHTVAAAGFRIGSLYEKLYDAVVGLAAPADLTPEQASVYHEEVRKRVRVLVEKALKAYEEAWLVGRHDPQAGPWTTRLEAAIARLRRHHAFASPLSRRHIGRWSPGGRRMTSARGGWAA